MNTNADVEAKIEGKFADSLNELGLLPNGYRCEVHLHGKNRKKHWNAEFEKNWNPSTDSIRVALKPLTESEITTAETPPTVADDLMADLVRALDRAENRPGYDFVSLKWFRDSALANEGYTWAADETLRHNVLRNAIDKRWILTSKVANPRPPNFPVTAIRLNHQMPEVNAALGREGGGPPAFRPVVMRGEALSATILRDRR